jgi:hypothetical protein
MNKRFFLFKYPLPNFISKYLFKNIMRMRPDAYFAYDLKRILQNKKKREVI